MKVILAILAFCPLLFAQQANGTKELNNDSVIKLIVAGLSDDLIVSTITTLPGVYDTSADGLIALKSAHASDKVVSAIVLKSTTASTIKATNEAPPSQELARESIGAPQNGAALNLVAAPSAASAAPGTPRVFLQSSSKGTNRNAARDQSMEMSKDLEKDCPGVRVTINQQVADYTVLLNHIEVGFVRDNQIHVANKDGDLISKTKEGGSIAGGLKKACDLILADWTNRSR